jgi:hypothetical protein
MRIIGGKSRILLACGVIVMSLALQACREDEQGQVLLYEKGIYLGKVDHNLTDAQKEALRYRTTLQRAQ